MERFSFLKDRALEFWEEGVRLFGERKYNLSAFHLEQAVQLWVKYLIGIKIGDWPRTHYLSDLINELSKAYECERVLDFYKEREMFFSTLEDAYFTSRYFPKVFSENGVGQLIKNAEDFLKLLQHITGEKFFA
jgi:HEPN domain-containing protein